MITFADSSALLTLYVDEPDRFGGDLEGPLVSQLARVEVPSAIWRKHRMAELSAGDARTLVDAFEADYFGAGDLPQRFVVVALTSSVLDDAARMTAAHGLRAYDAVQLATACAARAAETGCRAFAAFDRGLRSAAAAEGFTVLPAGNDG